MSGDRRRDQAVQAAAREPDIPETQSPPMTPIAPIGPITPIAPIGPVGLETVFRRHHEAVFRAAYRITGDAMDAEDVLQTVFTRLLRREAGQAGGEGWPHPEHAG